MSKKLYSQRKLPLRHLHQSVPHHQCSDLVSLLSTSNINVSLTHYYICLFMTLSSSSTGFGNRFSKPKGPRSYPETWVWGSRHSPNINKEPEDHERLLKISWKIKYCGPKKHGRPLLCLAQHSSTLSREQEVPCYQPWCNSYFLKINQRFL